MGVEGKGPVSGLQRFRWVSNLLGRNAGQQSMRFIDNSSRMRGAGIEGKVSRVDLVMDALRDSVQGLKGYVIYAALNFGDEGVPQREKVMIAMTGEPDPILVEAKTRMTAALDRLSDIKCKVRIDGHPAESPDLPVKVGINLSETDTDQPIPPFMATYQRGQIAQVLPPQHLITEDIEGTNPKDRGIVLGADPLRTRFEDAGPLRMRAFERTANLLERSGGKRLFKRQLWGIPFWIGVVRVPRSEAKIGIFQITADGDIRPAQSSRFLTMVFKVLNFDVSAWLRGNRK